MAGSGAAAGGALVNPWGFCALPGRWVLTWAAGGQPIRAGPFNQVGAGDWRGYLSAANGPGASIVQGDYIKAKT